MIVQQIVKTTEPLLLMHTQISQIVNSRIYSIKFWQIQNSSVNYIYKNNNNVMCSPFYLMVILKLKCLILYITIIAGYIISR